MLRGNFDFADSKNTWQLQLADMLVNIWWNVVRDYNATRGYLPLFRILHRNTVLAKDKPLGMVALREFAGQALAPSHFGVFSRIADEEYKLLPCDWGEK